MRISNPAALRQYQVRCGQIADAEADLATVEDRRQLARNTIDGVTVRRRWGSGGRGQVCSAAASLAGQHVPLVPAGLPDTLAPGARPARRPSGCRA